MFPFRTRKKKMWLFTWEYTRDDYFQDLRRQKIAAALDSRISSDFVKRYLPLLYFTERPSTIYEKVGDMYLASMKRHDNPNWKTPRYELQRYCYGSHPWLEARLVKDFFIDVVHANFEISYWTEYEVPDPSFRDEHRIYRPERRMRVESRRTKSGYIEKVFIDDSAPPAKCVSEDPEPEEYYA